MKKPSEIRTVFTLLIISYLLPITLERSSHTKQEGNEEYGERGCEG